MPSEKSKKRSKVWTKPRNKTGHKVGTKWAKYEKMGKNVEKWSIFGTVCPLLPGFGPLLKNAETVAITGFEGDLGQKPTFFLYLI